jgi:hypothetical protein
MVRYDVDDVDFYFVRFLITWMKTETVRPKNQGYTKTQSVCFHWIATDIIVSSNNMRKLLIMMQMAFWLIEFLFNEGKHRIAE